MGDVEGRGVGFVEWDENVDEGRFRGRVVGEDRDVVVGGKDVGEMMENVEVGERFGEVVGGDFDQIVVGWEGGRVVEGEGLEVR